MSSGPAIRKKLVERVLQADGAVPLALLLEYLAPVEAMRELAQRLGVTPKGGFRIDKAPARVLAPRLAALRDAEQLDDVLTLLAGRAATAAVAPGDAAAATRVGELTALLQLRDQDVARLRRELDRSREGQARGRDREAEMERELAAAREQAQVARRQLADLEGRAAPAPIASGDRTLRRRLHDLENEHAGLREADRALRRQLARDRSRVRELEDEVAELESLIPKSRLRKRRPLPPEPEPEPDRDRRFLLPYLQPSFYKSLVGKDRRAIERALQALLLFCTEGHGYPGLEVKPMGGQDTWSLRASLGLRIYFRPRADGDIEVLELGDREDQRTTLRRLKDR